MKMQNDIVIKNLTTETKKTDKLLYRFQYS